jgi:hypothetical protein
MGRVLLCWAAVGVAVPEAAAADPPRAVLLPIRHDLAGNAEAVLADVRAQLADRLDTLGYELLGEDVAGGCLPPPAAGEPEGRLAAAARACGSELAVEAEIVSSPVDFVTRLTAVDSGGRRLGTWENTCDFCAESEMIGRWSDLALELPPPDEAIERLAEDRRAAAVVPVGPDDGGSAGDTGSPPAAGPGIDDVPWWFWTAAAVAVAGVATGAALVVIDGEGTCDGPIHTCREIYDTDAGGYALLGVGVAGLAAAGIGLYFVLSDDESAGDEPESGSIVLFPSPVGLVVRGGFDL